MKRFTLTTLGVLLISLLSFAEDTAAPTVEISKVMKTELLAQLTAFREAFTKGNIQHLLQNTPPALKALVGGDEAYTEIARAQISETSNKVTFEDVPADALINTYQAGSDLVAFIPTSSIITSDRNNLRLNLISFTIATKQPDSTNWYFMDGYGVKDDPDTLWKLIPELPKGVQLPPNKIELLND